MSAITADRLERIKNIILRRVLQDCPDARFITDAQIVLDAATGAMMNQENLLGVIADNGERVDSRGVRWRRLAR